MYARRLPNRRAAWRAASSREIPVAISSRMRSSRWNWTSSSSSRRERLGPEGVGQSRPERHGTTSSLRVLEDVTDRGRDCSPSRLFRGELLPPVRRDLVDAGPASAVGRLPACLDRAGLLEPMEGWIQRSFLAAQGVFRHAFDGGGDAVAVERPSPSEQCEHEQRKRSPGVRPVAPCQVILLRYPW